MPAESFTRKWVAVIPAYREVSRIAAVVQGVRRHGLTPVVVDDGSEDGTAAAATAAGAIAVSHPVNRGKGAALDTGIRRASELNADWIVTMDADGQHDPDDLPSFLSAAHAPDAAVLVGNRMEHVEGMPMVRRCTNWLMSWLLSRTMGQRVPDTQCGYRAYARDILARFHTDSTHFDAESEILIRIARAGIRIDSVPIRTIYRDERSKIRPVRDTLRFLRMWRRCRKLPTSVKNSLRRLPRLP